LTKNILLINTLSSIHICYSDPRPLKEVGDFIYQIIYLLQRKITEVWQIQ